MCSSTTPCFAARAARAEPDLATKATIVDPSTIDVELRSGVKFSDGTPFDAQAVKTGVERTLAAATTQYPAEFKDLQSVTVTGPLSLRLALSQPVAGALPASGWAAVLHPVAQGDRRRRGSRHPSGGCGRVRVEVVRPGEGLVTEANPRFFVARNVKLGGVEFIAAQPGAPTVSLLKAGGADLAIVSGQDADTLRSSGFTVKTQGADDQMYWMPLCKTAKPLDQAEVRQALNYALNRDELNQALFSGAGEPQWALWPSKNVLFPKNLANFYKYDPKKAKQLLKAAGYPNGFETTVIVSTSPQVQLMAQVAASGLGQDRGEAQHRQQQQLRAGPLHRSQGRPRHQPVDPLRSAPPDRALRPRQPRKPLRLLEPEAQRHRRPAQVAPARRARGEGAVATGPGLRREGPSPGRLRDLRTGGRARGTRRRCATSRSSPVPPTPSTTGARLRPSRRVS